MRAAWALAVTALLLSACATTAPRGAHRTPSARPPAVNHAPRHEPRRSPSADALTPLAALSGWGQEDHAAAFAAFAAGCGVARDAATGQACELARFLGPVSDETARVFLESRFRATLVGGEGLLTAYFSPQYEARFSRQDDFTAAVRPKPDDLELVDPGEIGGSGGAKIAARRTGRGYEAYPTRADIEATPVERPLAWMRPQDLFFLQIQGSGTLVLPDGRRLRASVAATNGRTFVGIARPMREQGLLADSDTSGDAIRRWLRDHAGPDAEAVMALNPRYVFFKLAEDDGQEPKGAAGAPLPAGRAVAIDPSQHSFGEVLWIDADAPVLNGAFPRYRRLVMALDIGGAIKGPVRADLYMGRGDAAGAEAGRVRHTLRLWRLVAVDPDGR